MKVLKKNQKGAAMVEYALLVALIAIVAIVAITNVGTAVTEKFNLVADSLDSAGGGGGAATTSINGADFFSGPGGTFISTSDGTSYADAGAAYDSTVAP